MFTKDFLDTRGPKPYTPHPYRQWHLRIYPYTPCPPGTEGSRQPATDRLPHAGVSVSTNSNVRRVSRAVALLSSSQTAPAGDAAPHYICPRTVNCRNGGLFGVVGL